MGNDNTTNLVADDFTPIAIGTNQYLYRTEGEVVAVYDEEYNKSFIVPKHLQLYLRDIILLVDTVEKSAFRRGERWGEQKLKNTITEVVQIFSNAWKGVNHGQ